MRGIVQQNCRLMSGPVPQPIFPPPGWATRCDVLESCVPYEVKRQQYSLDFLCCDGDVSVSGYIAAHVANPMFAAVWFGDPWTAFVIAFLFEAFEVFMLTVFGDFGVFATTDLSLETWASSVLGDALINGGMGALLGWLLLRVWRVQGPMCSWGVMPTFWIKLKYVLCWVAYSATFIGISAGGIAGTLIAFGVQTVVLPVIVLAVTNWRIDRKVVWQLRRYRERVLINSRGVPDLVRKLDSTRSVGLVTRIGLFASVWFVTALLFSQTSGFVQWAANDWYQVWAVSVFVILLLAGVVAGN